MYWYDFGGNLSQNTLFGSRDKVQEILFGNNLAFQSVGSEIRSKSPNSLIIVPQLAHFTGTPEQTKLRYILITLHVAQDVVINNNTSSRKLKKCEDDYAMSQYKCNRSQTNLWHLEIENTR